uniref:Wsv289 n=1 Tax=Strongyloides papillosus TaxID=174720 RepID=A0A0N5B3C9_STREA
MKSDSSDSDDFLFSKKRVKFGSYTFVEPSFNFVMPRLLCCDGAHKEVGSYGRVNLDDKKDGDRGRYDVVINGSELLSYLTTKEKICIFEVSSDRVEESKDDFRREHIESANYGRVNLDDKKDGDRGRYDVVINGSELLSYLTTKEKICIFEVSSDRVEESKDDFRREHIESAKLIYYRNLSHIGVPVYPLQF